MSIKLKIMYSILANRQYEFDKAQLEANMAQYRSQVDSNRLNKGKKLEYHFYAVEKDSTGNAILHWKIPSQSHNDITYDTYIEIIPHGATLFALANSKNKIKDRIELLKNADVKCFCSCPDFNWAGMKYNMKHADDGYLDGFKSINGVPDGGEDIKPENRDPNGKNKICKHLVAAFNGTMLNANLIIKEVKNIKFNEPQKEIPNTIMNNKEAKPNENLAKHIIEESTVISIPESTEATNALADALSNDTENVSRETLDNDNNENIPNKILGDNNIEIVPKNDVNERINNITNNNNNNIVDIEEESKLPMFNVSDDEDTDEDEI